MKSAGETKFAGYGAALWALLFAILHIAWAAGFYVGLPAEQAREAFQHTWFLAYDLIAAGMCVVAVFLALALVQQFGSRLSVRLVFFFGWFSTGILAVRGIAGVIKIVYLAAIGDDIANPQFLWDFWFCLGAALFGFGTWNFQRMLINANVEKQ
jgi:Protein of unknown function (DUF3995)